MHHCETRKKLLCGSAKLPRIHTTLGIMSIRNLILVTILNIIALVLSSLMILPIGFFSFIIFIFGNIGQNTVVQSVESPNGAYRAELVDSDQGALGGDTLVDVYENKGINTLVFKISKKPQRVYQGEWGEFKSMKIYWKNDSCLVMNSVEYKFK